MNVVEDISDYYRNYCLYLLKLPTLIFTLCSMHTRIKSSEVSNIFRHVDIYKRDVFYPKTFSWYIPKRYCISDALAI